MKRSDSLAANVAELRCLIRSGVLASALLILLVSLPSFVPPLAHLLRPSRTCITGTDCFWQAIKAVVWHLRWPCVVLGAVTILLGGWLALISRSWNEASSSKHLALMPRHTRTRESHSSDADAHARGMSAKEIATRLTGLWTTKASGYAYSTGQRRLYIAIETNGDWDALRYERRDPNEDCAEFAHDLLAIIDHDLCAREQLALIRALAERLTAWQARRGREDDPVLRVLEELLIRHKEAMQMPRSASALSERADHE